MAYVFTHGTGAALCVGNVTGSVSAGGRVVLTDAVPPGDTKTISVQVWEGQEWQT